MSDEENMDVLPEDETDLPEAAFPAKKPPAKSEEELRAEFKRDMRKIRRKFLLLVCVCLVALIGYGIYYVATTDIPEAAREGKIWLIGIHLLLGADVNAIDEGGNTLLIAAITRGQEETVKFLLEKGANPNLTQPDLLWTRSPLHLVCWNFYDSGTESVKCNIARMLIEHGADVNAVDTEMQTPLHYAAQNNYPQLAELLIDNGAKINAPSRLLHTPLDKVNGFAEDSEQTTATLIKHGGLTFENLVQQPLTPDVKCLYFLFLNSDFDTTYRASILIRCYPELANIPDPESGKMFLHYCVYNNKPGTFRDLGDATDPWLRVNGIDLKELDVNVLDRNGRTPLDYAVEINNEKAIEILKKAGAKTGEELRKEAAASAGETDTVTE